MHKNKLVIVGVGHVGSYVLADAMKMGLFAEIGLIDILKNVSFGEALDQAQSTALTYMNNVDVKSGGYEQCADADVIIVAAGPSIIPDTNNPDAKPDRTLLTRTNCEVIREVMVGITSYTRDAIVILITNPLDTMVYVAENEFGYPTGRIFGTGTMLDSARLRKIVADACGLKMLRHLLLTRHTMYSTTRVGRMQVLPRRLLPWQGQCCWMKKVLTLHVLL